MDFRAQLSAPSKTQIAPDLFAAALGMEPDTLAQIAGIDASTLTQTPGDARLQMYLQDAVQVITAAGDIAETPESAITWFRQTAIPELGNFTAEQLVARHRTAQVLRYLVSVAAGASG